MLRKCFPQILRTTTTAGRSLPLVHCRLNASLTRQTKPLPPADTFLHGNSASYMEEMYHSWKDDPASVHLSWQVYFKNLDNGLPSEKAYQAPPNLVPGAVSPGFAPHAVKGGLVPSEEVLDHLKVALLVRAYQVRGHHLAKLDPLGITSGALHSGPPPELDVLHYGFTETDLSRSFTLGPGMLPGFQKSGTKMTLREIVEHLNTIYCGSIGIEYCHIPDRKQCDWIRERLEIPSRCQYSTEQKAMILDRLVWSDSFERFVATKWPSEKRFGLEGCEALIPGMKALIDSSVEKGIENIVIGMPHRGRLNVLSNVVRKPNESIFAEFSGSLEPAAEGSGDVKYHLGMNYERPTPSGKRVHLSLVANPSHLEAVDPVVLGKTRALQFYSGDEQTRGRSMGVLMHGDAAFAGQGVVYETLGLSDLASYTTGGTVHIIVNNQIGFTTDPRFARSTPYCTDIAKVVNAPIFHVNGDDVEAVTFVCQLAAEWRQTFKKDVVIDIVCYRRHGHNEVDQPSFTQPRMYKTIEKQVPTLNKYIEQLTNEKSFTLEEIDAIKKKVWQILEESYTKGQNYKATSREWLSSSWNGFKSPRELAEQVVPCYPSGANKEMLKTVGKAVGGCPKDFNVHPNLARVIQQRNKSIEAETNIDWPTAEGLAFGTLLLEGKHVRLSGQDVERGTFSQRHAVLHDQKDESQHVPLNDLGHNQARFTVCNSSLSEYGCLGYELGFSLVNPNSLVMWEAQFGDFANTAQVIIDQFIAAGEQKWLQRTGLTMLLPHGYDGQGPEHSSARLERYLQLCDEHPYIFPDEQRMSRQHQDCNMQVVYPSTPANYFHALRRQVHRDFRKPLIVMTSKSLLRHPLARSSLSEMEEGTFFSRYIGESHPTETDEKTYQLALQEPSRIHTHVLCSGQVYYGLLRARFANKLDGVAISRVEQLSPFPFDLVREHVDRYPNAKMVWAQEESLNMGGWSYVQPRIETTLEQTEHHKGKRVTYAGREPSASVATGNKKQHLVEEYSLISQALLGTNEKPTKVENGIPIWN